MGPASAGWATLPRAEVAPSASLSGPPVAAANPRSAPWAEMRLSPHRGLGQPRLLVACCFSFQIESSLRLERQLLLDRTRLRRFFNALSDRFGCFAADRVFEFQPGRLVDPLQLVPFFADLLNSLLRQAGVADTRTEQSDHPEARSLFFPADRDQGQAVIGRINRLRIGPVPASDLEVEGTRYDRLENPIADELRYQEVQSQQLAASPFD